MPFLRTAKGTKLAFSQAKLSALISLVYAQAIGTDKTPKFRLTIQNHCQKIWRSLEDMYGKDPEDEWPGSSIQKEIDEELRKNAATEIHEAFISMRINEFEAPFPKKNIPNSNKVWDRFEAKPDIVSKTITSLDNDKVNPVWGIYKHDKDKINNAEEQDNASDINLSLSERLGIGIGSNSAKKENNTEVATYQITRSQWINFWKSLTKKDIPIIAWEKHILSIPPDQQNKSKDGWWLWWQEQIDEVLKKDPRLYELRRALFERSKRANITNQNWFDGLLTENAMKLEKDLTGNTWYRRFAIEHLKHIFDINFPHIEWDWQEIQKAIKPDRDELVTWKGWQDLNESGALREITIKKWSSGDEPLLKCKELPQWTWMRLALAMSVYDPEENIRTKNAIELYNQISKLSLIPSAASLREAGNKNPRFFEDHTWQVEDNFNSIQKVIYSSAVDTVWTGTSASVWSKVRSRNISVRSGRRKSTGVNDFIRTMDAHQQAQGRVGDDRPVTVMLPVWHLDVEDFVSIQQEGGQRLQTVLLTSDIFMKRVAEGGTWTLLDPHIYPEVLEGSMKSYLKAEELVQERKKQHPNSYKIVSADRFWKRIISAIRLGSPFITFIDSDKSFSPVQNKQVVPGLDGIGSFPLVVDENNNQAQQIQWPAMAININSMISDQGEPLLEEWKDTITWAFWMAERMYDACYNQLSDNTKIVRPLCLGAVGFFEAIQKALMGHNQNIDEVSNWISKISEAWATLNIAVDQMFCQEFGPAPLWKDTKHKLDTQTFDPKKMYEKLKMERNGGTGIPPLPDEISDLFSQVKNHRYSVRTVWAPFKQAASWAGVSPGGFGTLFPIEWVLDEDDIWRITPTNYLLSEMKTNSGDGKYGQIFEFPEQPNKWPDNIRNMSIPDMSEWKVRLKHASIVRPWIDQGVSLTLPVGLPTNQLAILLQQAWWMGISSVRFEDSFKKPDINPTKV